MKKTILILHGWGVNGEKYQIIVGMLKEKGWVAFSPDLPGFGKEKLLKKDQPSNCSKDLNMTIRSVF